MHASQTSRTISGAAALIPMQAQIQRIRVAGDMHTVALERAGLRRTGSPAVPLPRLTALG